MPPNVNWDIIDSVVKGGSKTDDEEFMEEAFMQLRDVDGSKFQDDPQKLLLLFKSAVAIIDYREKTVDALIQEQAYMVEEKEAEIQHLNKELDGERRFGASGSLPQDAESYRAENRRLMQNVEILQENMENVKQELSEITAEKNDLEQELDKERRISKDLKIEVKEIRQEVRDYRSIIDDHQQQKFSAKGQEDMESREKMMEKNAQISDLLTQITKLEERNRELDEENRNIQQMMDSGQQDMEKMVDEYEKMKKLVGVSDHFTDDLHRQNEQLKMQVADFQDQLRSKAEEEDSIANAVNEKVDEWRKRLQEQDKDIGDKARTIAVLREKIAAASLDRDRINVERLTKKVEERDEQIKALQEGLNQAVNDLEEQTAIVQDLRRDKGTNREVLTYKSQIRELQGEVQKQQSSVRDAENLRTNAENEAVNNDAKLTEALKRISKLESGQYGLTEAVNEIKECKEQIRTREQKIQDLTKQINLVEEKLNDLLEENEDYRERLGVAPRNLEDIAHLRKSRALRQQQYRAENQVLLKEIEKLEDERLELKLQVRLQAQSYTQKAMGEGLHPDDFNDINNFIDQLKRNRKLGQISEKSVSRSDFEVSRKVEKSLTQEMTKLSGEAEVTSRMLNEAQADNKRLAKESERMASENEQLRAAMIDTLEALKSSQKAPQRNDVIRVPSLERLLHAMEAKQTDEGSGFLRGQVDQLTGRNEELRAELKHLRGENSAFVAKTENTQQQVAQLQAELGAMTQLAQQGGPSAMSFRGIPKKVDPSAEDVINALNEQLIQTLEELSKKDSSISDLKKSLEKSRSQLSVLRHQTHLIYKTHSDEKEKWSNAEKTLSDEKIRLQGKIETDEVQIQEYERLLDALKSSPEEMKKKVSETSRKVSLLRVNEKTLIRRHRALESTEDLLTSQNTRLRNEITQMEKAVAERIGYLERYKAMAAYKITALQKALEGSVPESELSVVNRRFDELTSKYRDLLQKENQFVAKNIKAETLQEEVKIITEEAEVLRQELALEKEKRHALEETLRKSGSTSGKSSSKFEVSSALKQNDRDGLSRAYDVINQHLKARKNVAKHAKWKYLFITVFLITLQLLQLILLHTIHVTNFLFSSLFTTFAAITIVVKLFEECWPLRKNYTRAKKKIAPLWHAKQRIEYSHMAATCGAQVSNSSKMVSEILAMDGK